MRNNGSKYTPAFLPADKEASWSTFLNLIVLLYPQLDRSGLRKLKKIKHQH